MDELSDGTRSSTLRALSWMLEQSESHLQYSTILIAGNSELNVDRLHFARNELIFLL